eukprot:5876870-Heterocapsa_arctica.AAC.1
MRRTRPKTFLWMIPSMAMSLLTISGARLNTKRASSSGAPVFLKNLRWIPSTGANTELEA